MSSQASISSRVISLLHVGQVWLLDSHICMHSLCNVCKHTGIIEITSSLLYFKRQIEHSLCFKLINDWYITLGSFGDIIWDCLSSCGCLCGLVQHPLQPTIKSNIINQTLRICTAQKLMYTPDSEFGSICSYSDQFFYGCNA
ncbi:unnamed protein product [Moneuplotes crassus]|uniref:Uncharacterized protein n=1 Tax=Euplotes crassus TaxID=5936 RepID=A0AAD2D456_EUPCR|nr:unnamed protein product [Moneuplotes crassus]